MIARLFWFLVGVNTVAARRTATHNQISKQNERDFYGILGVSKTATEIEIRKAYRKKVKENHPDVSDEKNAESLFVNITDAYDTLSDAETRAKYDRCGEACLKDDAPPPYPAGSRPGQGPPPTWVMELLKQQALKNSQERHAMWKLENVFEGLNVVSKYTSDLLIKLVQVVSEDLGESPQAGWPILLHGFSQREPLLESHRRFMEAASFIKWKTIRGLAIECDSSPLCKQIGLRAGDSVCATVDEDGGIDVVSTLNNDLLHAKPTEYLLEVCIPKPRKIQDDDELFQWMDVVDPARPKIALNEEKITMSLLKYAHQSGSGDFAIVNVSTWRCVAGSSRLPMVHVVDPTPDCHSLTASRIPIKLRPETFQKFREKLHKLAADKQTHEGKYEDLLYHLSGYHQDSLKFCNQYDGATCVLMAVDRGDIRAEDLRTVQRAFVNERKIVKFATINTALLRTIIPLAKEGDVYAVRPKRGLYYPLFLDSGDDESMEAKLNENVHSLIDKNFQGHTAQKLSGPFKLLNPRGTLIEELEDIPQSGCDVGSNVTCIILSREGSNAAILQEVARDLEKEAKLIFATLKSDHKDMVGGNLMLYKPKRNIALKMQITPERGLISEAIRSSIDNEWLRKGREGVIEIKKLEDEL